MVAIITIIFGIISLILLIIAIFSYVNGYESKSCIFNLIASLFMGTITVIAAFNVSVSTPNIFPSDNFTKVCYNEEEISIISDEGYDIYYTLDGSDPKNGIKYESTFTITETCTVCTRAKYLIWWSGISKSSYTFKDNNEMTSTPTPTPESTIQPTPQPMPEHTPQPTPKPTLEITPEPTPDPTPKPQLISIRDVSEFYSDGIDHSISTITDNIGETYEGYTYMSAGNFWAELEGSVVYRNDNQYNRFFGRVIIDKSEKDIEECGWVKIYGDDTLLFDSGIMGRGVEPVDFDLYIRDYSEIKIDFKDGDWSSKALKYPQCYLVNTYFEE